MHSLPMPISGARFFHEIALTTLIDKILWPFFTYPIVIKGAMGFIMILERVIIRFISL